MLKETPVWSTTQEVLAKQIIKFSGLEPYKDIDIKIVGSRKGERLIEPLWLKEENPTPTKYKKLLQLDNKEYTNERLEVLLKALHPICFYTPGHEARQKPPCSVTM